MPIWSRPVAAAGDRARRLEEGRHKEVLSISCRPTAFPGTEPNTCVRAIRNGLYGDRLQRVHRQLLCFGLFCTGRAFGIFPPPSSIRSSGHAGGGPTIIFFINWVAGTSVTYVMVAPLSQQRCSRSGLSGLGADRHRRSVGSAGDAASGTVPQDNNFTLTAARRLARSIYPSHADRRLSRRE